MSKIKKKPVDRSTTTISEKDIEFIKIIEFSGWMFILALIGFFVFWGVFDYAPDNIEFLSFIGEIYSIDIELDTMVFAFIVFTGSNAALSFGMGSRMNKNRDKKREIFLDWLVAEFFFCMFAIFSLAAYQW